MELSIVWKGWSLQLRYAGLGGVQQMASLVYMFGVFLSMPFSPHYCRSFILWEWKGRLVQIKNGNVKAYTHCIKVFQINTSIKLPKFFPYTANIKHDMPARVGIKFCQHFWHTRSQPGVNIFLTKFCCFSCLFTLIYYSSNISQKNEIWQAIKSIMWSNAFGYFFKM